MSQTQFVFSADSADLVRQSRTVAQAAKAIELAHVSAGRAANMSIADQLRATRQLEAAERRRANELRRERLDTARRATRLLPGGIGEAAAGRLAGSGLSVGALGGIAKAAGALSAVAIAAGAVVATYRVMTAVLQKNTALQAAQDQAASASVRGTANASQEFVKNTGALDFLSKQRIVAVDVPQLQRELNIAGFDDLVRAVGAATSAGGSASLAVDSTRQAAMLYPFDPASVQVAAPQLALIAKALDQQNAQLAAGIVLKTNEYSPIKDIGQLAQALPSIFSSARRIGASPSEFSGDAKFAANLFANIASETADKTGEETKTLLRTLIPLMNRFFADRTDVGGSLSERFSRLTANAQDRAAFLGMSGVPGGSQRDVVEKLFTTGSALNSNVTKVAGDFANLSGATAEYHRQITELTATTKLAVQQNKLLLDQETRNREPGAQARGTLRDILEQAKGLGYSDQGSSIAALAGNRALFEGLLQSDAFVYGDSSNINKELQAAIDRMIAALETGGITTTERSNIESLRNLKGIANQTVQIDQGSRVQANRDYMAQNMGKIDAYEQSLARREVTTGMRRYLGELEQRDKVAAQFGSKTNYAGGYRAKIQAIDQANATNNALYLPVSGESALDRRIRLEQAAALDSYRNMRDNQLPKAINSYGQYATPDGMRNMGTEAARAFGEGMAEALTSLKAAADDLAKSAAANAKAADNLKETSQPSRNNRTANARSDRAAGR